MEVRLANELPPKPTTGMFTGGVLLGRYEGPAGKGEIVEIRSSPGWENKRGHYLIIQIDMDARKDRLNLKEVFAYGHSHLHTSGTVAFVKIKETSIFEKYLTDFLRQKRVFLFQGYSQVQVLSKSSPQAACDKKTSTTLERTSMDPQHKEARRPVLRKAFLRQVSSGLTVMATKNVG